MKLFYKGKDGGPESKVTGYWLIESKKFFSIALLRFDKGSREAFHTHAFHAVSWILRGRLLEVVRSGIFPLLNTECNYTPSLVPVFTSRSRYHRVFGMTNITWVVTFRGPWLNNWKEYLPAEDRELTLTHGRKEVNAGTDS